MVLVRTTTGWAEHMNDPVAYAAGLAHGMSDALKMSSSPTPPEWEANPDYTAGYAQGNEHPSGPVSVPTPSSSPSMDRVRHVRQSRPADLGLRVFQDGEPTLLGQEIPNGLDGCVNVNVFRTWPMPTSTPGTSTGRLENLVKFARPPKGPRFGRLRRGPC
jgi:hypothetical protein